MHAMPRSVHIATHRHNFLLSFTGWARRAGALARSTSAASSACWAVRALLSCAAGATRLLASQSQGLLLPSIAERIPVTSMRERLAWFTKHSFTLCSGAHRVLRALVRSAQRLEKAGWDLRMCASLRAGRGGACEHGRRSYSFVLRQRIGRGVRWQA